MEPGLKQQFEILQATDNAQIANMLMDDNFPIRFNNGNSENGRMSEIEKNNRGITARICHDQINPSDQVKDSELDENGKRIFKSCVSRTVTVIQCIDLWPRIWKSMQERTNRLDQYV